ncbi:hypothetical protein AK88_04395 [Plasmodium fragile]|uniref:Peptidase A2 domain-containing protein n=1 Tax=Plasmodium fragile TaxID=5857 RepID=A0A0D9QJS6_PLAFR|nr:uncharacterized protein AK88_04395 [Plasmodium fragile]KJP85986.1 hypothetical protein AK88_04395 [Plasmodium fragile]
MPVLFGFLLLSLLLFDFYDTLKLRSSADRIIHVSEKGSYLPTPWSLSHSSNARHLFIHNKNGFEGRLRCDRNNPSVKRRKEELFLSRDEPGFVKNEMKIETFKSPSGNEFLCTKLMMNNKEKRFIVDLCSDNSFLFFRGDDFLFKNDSSNGGDSFERDKGPPHLWFGQEDVQNVHEELYLNNTKVEVEKVVKAKGGRDKKLFQFYLMQDKELDKNLDGIIGFDFFSHFNTFLFDSVNMKIELGGEDASNIMQQWASTPDGHCHKVKVHNYSDHIKYFSIDVNNKLYKGLLDSGTSKTLVINSDVKLEREDQGANGVAVENILNQRFTVSKLKNINRFTILTKDSQVRMPLQMNEMYVSENVFPYLDSNVVLLGLDFLLNRKLLFDLKNGTLYMYCEATGCSPDTVMGEGNSPHAVSGDIKNNPVIIDQVKVEQKCAEIYEKLKSKELSFLNITKELEKDQVDMQDCKSTNDVIKKYATKILYGAEQLPRRESSRKDDPEFEQRYNEMTNFFKKLSPEEKQNMLNKMVHALRSDYRGDGEWGGGSSTAGADPTNEQQYPPRDNHQYERASEILEKYVVHEMEKKQYSLHRFKSCNANRRNEKAVEEEFNHLSALYNAHPEFSFEILNDFKRELSGRRINVHTLQSERDIIRKVAETRVYNQNGNLNKEGRNRKRKNIIVRRFSNDDNNIHTQIIIRRNGLDPSDDDNEDGAEEGKDGKYNQYGNLDRMEDLFPNSLFSGIFKNFFGDNNRSEHYRSGGGEDSDEGGGYDGEEDHQDGGDLLSELNNFFGFGNMGENFFRKKKKSVIGFKTKDPTNMGTGAEGDDKKRGNGTSDDTSSNISNDISNAIKEEKDTDIIYLLHKVQKLNDANLKSFILQSLKNDNVRRILVDALKKGYQSAHDECRTQGDNKGMYLLQMLKQTGIF